MIHLLFFRGEHLFLLSPIGDENANYNHWNCAALFKHYFHITLSPIVSSESWYANSNHLKSAEHIKPKNKSVPEKCSLFSSQCCCQQSACSRIPLRCINIWVLQFRCRWIWREQGKSVIQLHTRQHIAVLQVLKQLNIYNKISQRTGRQQKKL